MQEFSRSSDETEAIRAVKILKEKLVEANTLLSKWMIELDANIDARELSISITIKKPFGGGGIIKTISRQDAEYFASDISSLVNEIVDQIFELLYRQQIYDDLHDKLFLAIRNVNKMSNK